jgi:MFS superfamily sulfate permease-like transporter
MLCVCRCRSRCFKHWVCYVVISVLGRTISKVDGHASFVDLSEDSDAEPVDGTLILRLEGPLHFANIGRIRELFSRIETFGDVTHHPSETPRNANQANNTNTTTTTNKDLNKSPNPLAHAIDNTGMSSAALPATAVPDTTSTPTPMADSNTTPANANASGDSNAGGNFHTRLIIDMSPVRSVDGAATQAFLEILSEFRAKQIIVILVGVRTDIYATFGSAGLPQLLGADRFKQTLNDAVADMD